MPLAAGQIDLSLRRRPAQSGRDEQVRASNPTETRGYQTRYLQPRLPSLGESAIVAGKSLAIFEGNGCGHFDLCVSEFGLSRQIHSKDQPCTVTH